MLAPSAAPLPPGSTFASPHDAWPLSGRPVSVHGECQRLSPLPVSVVVSVRNQSLAIIVQLSRTGQADLSGDGY